MKKNLKVFLAIVLIFIGVASITRVAYGSFIDNFSILRQTPPPPPTPPTKPEPSPPPTPPCGDPGCPTPSLGPEPTPTSTPTPTPPQEEGGGTGGAPFQFGGPPPPGPAQPQVLGLADTSSGNFEALLFTMGALCISVGLKVSSRKSSKAKN